jgi:hypothetical protein
MDGSCRSSEQLEPLVRYAEPYLVGDGRDERQSVASGFTA